MLFRGKSFNVKLVNDNLIPVDDSKEPTNPIDKLMLTQAYADLGINTVAEVAITIGAVIAGVAVTKTLCRVVELGANRIFR